jgi:hypothetical protein
MSKQPRRPRKPWLEDRRRDIELAAERLGGPEDRCRWILDDFTARDPHTLPKTERALWRDKLMALVLGVGVGRGMWRWMTIGENEPLDEELYGLWQRVGQLVAAHQGPVLLPPLTGALARLPGDAGATKTKTPYVRLTRTYRAEDFESALLHAVADLLIGCERLRECDECHRLFVATRGQKRLKVCARRQRDREWNKKKRERKNKEGDING